MQDKIIIIVILAIIAILVTLTVGLFFASILRRGLHDRKYRELDRLRSRYRAMVLEALASGRISSLWIDLSAPPASSAWQAVEEVLLTLMTDGKHSSETAALFAALGYPAFYEKRLTDRNAQARAQSVNKLGKMKNSASVPLLIPLLDGQNREIASVTVRALGNIGGNTALGAIVDRLPHLIGNGLVAGKALETTLLAFGPEAAPALIGRLTGDLHPHAAAIALEVLSRLPADERTISLAAERLGHENPEVRSKALKVLGRPEHLSSRPDLSGRIAPLLRDPVWYVRLQAIRSLSALKCAESMAELGALVSDEKWHVRNEAARALLLLGDCSLDFLIEALTGRDQYAKDSICEEIESTNFHALLIGHLAANDDSLRDKSLRILEIMYTLGFSIPLEEYRNSVHGAPQNGDKAEGQVTGL